MPAGEEKGSKVGRAPPAEVEADAFAAAEASPDGRATAVPASDVEASVAITGAAAVAVPVASAAPAAASNPPATVVAWASGVFVPRPQSPKPGPSRSRRRRTAAALAPFSPARVACEGCEVLPTAPLGLLLGWPSAVAVRAQCVASALWNGAPGGAPGGAPSEAPGGAPEGGLDRLAPLEGEPEGSEPVACRVRLGCSCQAPGGDRSG